MRWVWVVIPLVLIGVIGMIGIQESDASCVRNQDWPKAPCFDTGPVDKTIFTERWSPYYEYKGSAFMEWKKIEMFQALENEKFKEWLYDENNPFIHYNVYSYYLSIGEITNQFPVKRGGYMGNVGVSEQNPSSLDVDVPDNPKQSQEKIIITMVPNSSYPPACDPSIPPYDKPNCFLPAIAYVNIDQPVVFENSKPSVTMIASGNPQHGPDGIFESPPIPPGSSYEISFDKEGIYNYFDFVAPWMAGTIIVGTSTTNLPPVANAGQDRIIVEGKSVQLSLVGDDPENGKFRYSWQQISGPTVKLSNVYYPEGPISNDFPYLHTTSKTPYFTAPNVYATTSFVFEATVIDNTLQRATDTVQITIVDDFSSKNYPMVITEDFDELDKTLEDAKEKLETVMRSGGGTIPIHFLFVDEQKHVLVVGITPSEDALSIEEYEIRIKKIVGDIPMNVGFASFIAEDVLLVKKIFQANVD